MLVELSAALALVTVTAAGCFALLSWEILRQSPFGRAIGVLTAAMVVFTLYHVLVVALPEETTLVRLLQSGTYTVIVLFILLVIRTERRVRTRAEGEQP